MKQHISQKGFPLLCCECASLDIFRRHRGLHQKESKKEQDWHSDLGLFCFGEDAEVDDVDDLDGGDDDVVNDDDDDID